MAPDNNDIFIMNYIDEIHSDFPGFGSRLISDRLKKKYKVIIGRKRTRSYMRLMGLLENEANGFNRYDYPYLMESLTIDRPNQVFDRNHYALQQCMDGQGSRSPEDVGGVEEYERFIEIISNPTK